MNVDALPALLGSWCFDRSITDALLHRRYTAQGQMQITYQYWLERGMMHGMAFHQRYCVHIDEVFSLMFRDGSLFFTIGDIHKSQTIRHVCKNDLYEGRWLLQEGKLSLQWNVIGQKKNYSMITTYCKADRCKKQIARS